MVRPIRTPTIKPNADRRLQGKGPAAVLGSPRLSVTPEFDGAGRPHDVEIVEQRKGAAKLSGSSRRKAPLKRCAATAGAPR
jgi:hypothetical protein